MPSGHVDIDNISDMNHKVGWYFLDSLNTAFIFVWSTFADFFYSWSERWIFFLYDLSCSGYCILVFAASHLNFKNIKVYVIFTVSCFSYFVKFLFSFIHILYQTEKERHGFQILRCRHLLLAVYQKYWGRLEINVSFSNCNMHYKLDFR